MADIPGTFTCAVCRETFNKGRTDDETMAEARSAFSPAELEDAVSVCDYCWNAMRVAMPYFDARYTDG